MILYQMLTSIFFKRCDNKNFCQISASDYNFGPDPCPDTERYVEAHYICVQKKSFVTTGTITVLIVYQPIISPDIFEYQNLYL